MKTITYKTFGILLALALLMFVTRFKHFGSSVTLPDASLAVFFLGGLYLSRLKVARWLLLALLLEAASIDYWATTQMGVSDWCITPAYPFLALAYFALWATGDYLAQRRHNSVNILAASGIASALAFLISNASFYLFSGRYANMSAFEYSSRVMQYLPSYIAVALLYVTAALVLHAVLALRNRRSWLT